MNLRCGSPGNIGHGRIFESGELHYDSGVANIFVIQPRLKIGERRSTSSTKRHDFVSLINEPFLVKLTKDPPDRLHEGHIHGFVVVLYVEKRGEDATRTGTSITL